MGAFFEKMDNLSSSELDSPSKTPLFIAIAAVIVALAALYIGWMGFTRASELEAKVASLEEAASQGTGLEEAVQLNSDRLEKVASNMNTLSKSVSEAINEVSSDISKSRSDIRKAQMDAGMAKKMVEELEAKGVKVEVVQAPSSPTSQAAKAPDAAPGKPGVYTIKSGDNFGKIAGAYKISVSQLEAANPGVDSRRLRIGQQIVVPAPSN